MDELFEMVTLIQTGKIKPFPVVLIGKEYWSELLDWMKSTMLKEKNIHQNDLSLFQVADDAKEAVRFIKNFYKKKK